MWDLIYVSHNFLREFFLKMGHFRFENFEPTLTEFASMGTQTRTRWYMGSYLCLCLRLSYSDRQSFWPKFLMWNFLTVIKLSYVRKWHHIDITLAKSCHFICQKFPVMWPKFLTVGESIVVLCQIASITFIWTANKKKKSRSN